MTMRDEIRFEQLKLQLDRIHLMMTEPESYMSFKLLVDDLLRGRMKLSKSLEKWVYKLLRRALAKSVAGGAYRVAGSKQKLRERDWERYESAYKKGPKHLLEWLKYRFENNKKHGKTKGEWKLTEEQIDWIFNTSVVFKKRKVSLYEIGNNTMMTRIDPKGDLEINNIRLVYRFKRKRRGVTRDLHRNYYRKKMKVKGRVIVFFDGGKNEHPWRLANGETSASKGSR